MQQMFDFGSGPGGSMISGKWINRKTGDVINVRDSFIDDSNNMILMTDKGQMTMNEFSKYYIQASDEIYDQSGKVIENKPVQTDEIKFSNEEMPLEADNIYSNNVLSKPLNNTETKTEKNLNNFDLIDKIFKKIESKPKADLKIEWADFPEKELSMLVNYFDVTIDDIATYIGKYLINENLLKEALSDFLYENVFVD